MEATVQDSNIIKTAKEDWLRKHDGPVMRKEVNLGSPTIKHIYKRTYEQLGRNCHFIAIFGRVLIGEDKIAEAEAIIQNRLKEVMTATERKVNSTRALVDNAGIENTAQYNKLDAISAAIIEPVQGRYLNILAMADEYLRLVSTLWLEDQIGTREKSKAELEVKHLIRGIASTTRKMRLFVQAKVSEARSAGAKGLPAAEDAPASDGGSDAAELPAVEGEAEVAAPKKARKSAKAEEVAEAKPEAVVEQSSEGAAELRVA